MKKWQILISILLEITTRQTHILIKVKIFLLNPSGGSTWEREREQETSGKTQERRLTDSYIDSLYKELSKHYGRTSDATHYDNPMRMES